MRGLIKNLSYRSKLLLNFAALFIVFAVVLVCFQYHREKLYRWELLETRLRSYSDLVANSLESRGVDNDSVQLAAIMRMMPAELRLTVVSRQGKVKYDSNTGLGEKLDDHSNRPEVHQAIAHAEGCDVRLSHSTGVTYFYYAKSYGGFVVRVALPYTETVQNFMKADNVYLWFALLVFALMMLVLIRVSDHFGRALVSLRHFIQSADRGLIDYAHIEFPHTELGDIGRSIMLKYKQLEATGRQIAAERERLMRHFHYFEGGIAIFSSERKKVYANPRFMQFVNTILERPTPDVNVLWNERSFAPAVEFLDISGGKRAAMEEAPVFRFTITAGGNYFMVQLLVYNDGSFEMTLTDVTRSEKNKLLKQQMSNNITHELRTPVSSIRGYIETILSCRSLSPEKQHYFLERAHAQVVRLTDLIRDVALISKTEEAPETMPREEIDINSVVSDIVEELRGQFSESKMKVTDEIPPHTSINGNYALVYSIFRNLMENSIRYSGEGTEIGIERYNEDKEYYYFRFYDTGVGVPDEHLSRLFERFYRVTEGRTRDCGGTGLGLSIVRNAVLFHSGNISVRNRKGGGLEFLFSLHR